MLIRRFTASFTFSGKIGFGLNLDNYLKWYAFYFKGRLYMDSQSFTSQVGEYDRSNIMFTPDGRIVQVEYAKKTIKQGSTAIGLCCKDGVLIVIDKRNDNKLLASDFTEKIMQVDEHIGVALAGMLSDGRVLVEKSQIKAQQHRVTYDTKIDVKSVTKHICEEKQAFTQFGGLRPFGVSLMVAGFDDKPRLFVTEPIGTFLGYKAAVIGEGADEIKGKLAKSISRKLSIKEGLRLCIKLIRNFVGKEFSIDRIDGFYIETDNQTFTRFSKKEINNAN